MKILFIHQHFYPEPSGTAKSCTEMSTFFASKGDSVTVITEFPNRGFKSFANEKKLKQIDYYKGVKIFRLKNKFEYSSNKLVRILAYLFFTLNSTLFSQKISHGFDICITIQALPSAIPGIILEKFNKIHHYFYCTDMMPDLGLASGMIRNKMLIKFSRYIERFVYNNSHSVFAVTKSMVNNIKVKTNHKRIFVLSDWLDDKFHNRYKDKYKVHLLNKYNLKDKKAITYIGNIGKLQNLKCFIDVAEMMQSDSTYNDFIFIFGGSGIQRPYMEEECKRRKLKNVIFIGVVDRKLVPCFLKISNILIMNYINHPHMGLYRSSKIFDYIVAEKPVLVGASGELAKIVQENNLGLVAKPSDSEDLFEKLKNIINTNWVIKNKSLINKYSKTNVLTDFYERIQNVEKKEVF